MAQALLGGLLPAVFSGADQLKRGVYGLLTNPQEQAERAAQSLLQSRAERQALMARTFANPDRPFQVTNQAGLAQLTDQVMSGELGFAPAGITAFHGTPHNILGKFDINKVGTGEGNQAFGYGMYFAENPNVALSYTGKEGVKPTSVIYQGKSYPYESDVAKLLVDVNKFGKEEAKKLYPTQSKFIDEVKPLEIGFQSGNLYKVDIPDKDIPTMMDWDKPLGEQSDFVKKAINNLKKQVTPEMKMELGDDLNLLFGKDITPAQFLNTWEIIHPSGGTGIGEKLLNEQGVKGIRYLDNTSRDAGKGTSNFVVFDPTDVKILERNNQPVEGLLGSTNLMPIYHGTDPKAAKAIEKSGFDINKSADGTIWFTSNPDIGEVAATGKGAVVQRYLDENKVKLGGWDEIDKFSVDELIQKGFDGVKLQDETGTVFQIFNPEKLTKGLLD
jgi:hypothetical protein